ncbi:SDR family NAD(P)-dependent oxidoreductase [Halalkalicoccus sp. NIPERK01]|uniref:SDR family NAD(P)-dependent oxidoreductase n=1 Tax=Halalkalicoccus sp. NIPERK01 TaxID=3053469 RepID=UPI00256F46F9|nr:SDR family NAD(P)-dependent oxidoreductase [Halalkalicoccus sp. NIPERK01]MDL5361576.1 SDR family NAD(P)-dependent oxidoreductase [Halalkalicoccus sp. NIPERK01]
MAGRRFEGRTALVTGAAAGIGRATAKRLASDGVVTDVDGEGGEETLALLENEGGNSEFRELDVTDAGGFEECVEEVAAERGLDALVNNAGIGHETAAVEETDRSTLDRVIDVNCKGVWNGCRAALPIMKAQESGVIVNVASLAGLIGLPKQAAYSLTKGAVVNFTRTVAVEAGPYGVRANAVCPGFIETALGEAFFEGRDDPEKARARMEAQYPLKRLGRPEEVADAIAYLASDEASYVTGHGLVLDGGYSIA